MATALVVVVAEPAFFIIMVLVGAAATYETNRQRSAFAGRQSVALFGALTAIIPTLTVWSVLGTTTVPRILDGYAAGAFWQASFATAAAYGTTQPAANVQSRPVLWPVAYIAATQIHAMIDRFLLAGTGNGMAASAAFGYNLADAVVLVLAGPLAAEIVAGRLSFDRSRRLLLIGGVVTATYLLSIPAVLGIAVKGGNATGEEFDQLVLFALLYGTGMIPALWWIITTREMLSHQIWWALAARTAGLMLVVHCAFSVLLRVMGASQLIPFGWLIGTAAGAMICRRPTSLRRIPKHAVRSEHREENVPSC
ncbi:hypothetical protein [Frankia sp. Cas4]|uniref:hypothetical protein n=1 Tax=Frankia sp. Cas4 TaxID=3073927 RepID=UPI002AD22D17|nr:hypothetical protein [Frankia sp. Cas4]